MEKYKVVDPKTGRGDYMYDHLAMQEQVPSITENEVINPTIDLYPLVLGETVIFAVADTREQCFTFWQQTFGPPVPLVEGRQVIRSKVRILTFLELQRSEPKRHPERIEEALRAKVARSRKRKSNSPSSLRVY